MQPSKEESSEDDPLDRVDELLDDDLAGGDAASADPDTAVGDPDATTGSDATAGGSGRVGVDGRWFSVRSFVLAVLAIGAGTFLGGLIPLIGGTIGSVVGVLLGAFLVGLALPSRNYVETGVAGAGIGAGSALTSVLGVGFLPVGLDYLGEWGLPLLAAGGGIGLVLGLVGHYLGRDLRAGVTGELPD